MRPSTLAISATLLLSPPALAEETAPGELVSRYWLEEPLSLGATLGFPNHLFSLTGSGSGKEKNLDYSPPQVTDLTLSTGYGPFQFSYKVPLPQSAAGKATYGRAEYTDMAFEFGRDQWAASLYYQSFSGFYTDLNGNTGNYARIGSGAAEENRASAASASLEPQDILRRPDIRTRHYGAIGWHSFPLKGEGDQAFRISFHSIFDKPSPGFNLDFVQHVFLDRAQLRAGLPFVPEMRTGTFGNGAGLRGLDATSAGAGVGLASSYVFEESAFFLDGLLSYGGGAQRQLAEYVADRAWRTAYVDNVNFRFGVNYRGESQNAGLHFWTNTLSSRVGDIRVHSSNMALELSYVRTI